MAGRFSTAAAGAGIPAALASAALFGASTPFAKILIGDGLDPFMAAGLLYLGSGAGLAVVIAARALVRRGPAPEAGLKAADLPWLALVIAFGGVIGPLLLMIGLRTTPGSTAALMLNLESLATLAIAWLAFGESVDRRLLLGAAAILGGAVLLSWPDGQSGGPAGLGALAIAGACLAWGIDNNLTRRISAADPMTIAAVKGLAAGSVNLALGLAGGAALPGPETVAAAGLVGFLGYGVSLSLFVVALRHLGTARAGAYFATAPFIGAALAIPLLSESLSWPFAASAVLMGAGVWLHLTERHSHAHHHHETVHEHAHVHDDHHRHAHGPDDPAGEPHSHVHRHEPMDHEHPHFPDLHHRHGHGNGG